MITLSEKIVALLAELETPVFYFYPQRWERLPVVSWRESGNHEIAQADGREILAELTYDIDIWSDFPAENQKIFVQIDDLMSSLRFRRDFMEDLFDSRTGRCHRAIRYRAIADASGNIYQ